MDQHERYRDSEAVRQQRRVAEAEAWERQCDEWDTMVYRGALITQRARNLATRMMLGTASLGEVQAMLAEDHSNEPYADLSALHLQCALVGLDPSTGQPI